jgi:starch phosphorylase
MATFLGSKWSILYFGEVKLETNDKEHIFEVQVYFNDIGSESVQVQVELYASSMMKLRQNE